MADLPTPINGAEQYLAAILDELRALRAERQRPEPPPGTVELREPATADRSAKKKRTSG